MRVVLAFLLIVPSAFAQTLSFGLRAGVPATDAIKSEHWSTGKYYPASGRYTFGPSIELNLPAGLSVGLDLLYRPVEYRSEGITSIGSIALVTKGNSWQFPVIGKYRFTDGFVRPYAALGFSFDRLCGLKELGNITSLLPLQEQTISSDEPRELVRRSRHGWVIGAGIEGRLPLVKISPELRFTRWASEHFSSSVLTGTPLSNRNQFEALIGISF